MGTPTESDVRNLLDRAEVYDLFCRYCDALDSRQWELLNDVFTPGVTTFWPSGTEEQGLEETSIQGRDEVVRWLQQIFADFGPTHHLVSNLVLSVDGEQGTATCRVRAHHVAEVGGRRIFEESLARFSGTVQKTAEGWRFETWRESIAIALGDPDELAGLLQEHATS